MLIRQAELDDAGAVFALLRQFATSHRPHRPDFEKNYELLLAESAYDGTDLLVADDDGTLIGYALATRFLVLHANGPICQLNELTVAGEHRGNGVGRQLVEAIIGRARMTGAVEITVPTRRAAGYYRRFGFEETATLLKLSLA
ncbi:GNAT family N-acetyltransferase [Amycolatopsis pigmentata]|uniref:GNAT family N-acetyltransferase n=1 Tax=Amycolatopsis pigmentata TaxID=450801 RepID=A0ABW5FUI4_9PSEU